jgi:hypothetical protein
MLVHCMSTMSTSTAPALAFDHQVTRLEQKIPQLRRDYLRDGAKALTLLVAKRPRRKALENFMVAVEGWRSSDEGCVRAR